MAIWQFKLYAIPVAGILAAHGEVPSFLAQYRPTGPEPTVVDLAAFVNYWAGVDMRGIADEIAGFLPERKSWSKEARMFGDEDDNDVEVWPDDVRCRWSLRAFSRSLAEEFLNLARRRACLLALDDGGLVRPEWSELSPRIEASNAYRFCADPVGFLQSLARPN